MLSEFNKYQSIPTNNSLGRFGVFEKIHGANLSIAIDGDSKAVYNRTGLLVPGSNFFNWEEVLAVNMVSYLKLFQRINLHYTTITENQPKNMPVNSIQIYGELFGGAYPGIKEKGQMKVNKGINYCSTNQFLPFDVKVFVDGGSFMLDQILFQGFAEQIELLISKPLFIGTMRECLLFDAMINSTIPKIYDMPELDTNICEGVVIKPWSASNFNKGLMIKVINPTFKGAKMKPKRERTPEIIPEHIIKLIDTFDQYITPFALDKLLSKHLIDRTGQNIPKISKMFVEELYDDVIAEENIAICDDDWKAVRKKISGSVFNLVRETIV